MVAQVLIPDTKKLAELYLMDTSGSELYRESLAQVRALALLHSSINLRYAPRHFAADFVLINKL